jgi:hypothetical protein
VSVGRRDIGRIVSTDDELVEIWGDRVSLRDMVVALAVCGAATVAAVVLGRAVDGSEFFWGLGGAVIGFLLAVVLIRPKRDVQITDDLPSVPAVPAAATVATPADDPGSTPTSDPPEAPARPGRTSA